MQEQLNNFMFDGYDDKDNDDDNNDDDHDDDNVHCRMRILLTFFLLSEMIFVLARLYMAALSRLIII